MKNHKMDISPAKDKIMKGGKKIMTRKQKRLAEQNKVEGFEEEQTQPIFQNQQNSKSQPIINNQPNQNIN
jgi:hypothetical protein